MLHKIDTVIVGGGQAGLAISYYLTQEGREHVALERAPAVANAWRNRRRDSFTLITSNFQVRMQRTLISTARQESPHIVRSGTSDDLMGRVIVELR